MIMTAILKKALSFPSSSNKFAGYNPLLLPYEQVLRLITSANPLDGAHLWTSVLRHLNFAAHRLTLREDISDHKSDSTTKVSIRSIYWSTFSRPSANIYFSYCPYVWNFSWSPCLHFSDHLSPNHANDEVNLNMEFPVSLSDLQVP